MLDLRQTKIIELDSAQILKQDAAYLVIDTLTGKKLVVKQIGNYVDIADQILVAEFKKMALLSSEQNICTVYFLATSILNNSKNSCYLMEYVDGESLGALVANTTTLTALNFFDLFQQVVSAIEKSHAYGICHLDLHAENILIDSFGNIKVIDFLWHELNEPQESKQRKDMESLVTIFDLLFKKINIEDQRRIIIIRESLLKLKNLKGFSKKIESLREAFFELSFLNENSNMLFAHLIHTMELFDGKKTLSAVYAESGLKIPDTLSSEDIDASGFIDLRALEIDKKISKLYKKYFSELERAGLCECVAFVPVGCPSGGPYAYQYSVSFTSKFFKWLYLNTEIKFINDNQIQSISSFVAKDC